MKVNIMQSDSNTLTGKFYEAAIDRGVVDRWLRDICPLVPQRTQEQEYANLSYDILPNIHTLKPFASGLLPAQENIEKLKGYEMLLGIAACNDIKLVIDMGADRKLLEVEFEPEEPFNKSTIFGSQYTNVTPLALSRLKK